MSQVVLLNDISQSAFTYGSRYVGPYVLAHQLENSGFSTAVIDHFTRCSDFFAYLKSFLDPGTLLVGIATTFLSPKSKPVQKTTRDLRYDNFLSPYLWCDSAEQLEKWLVELRRTVKEIAPNCKIVLGGAKATAPFECPFDFPNPYRDVDYLVFGYADESIVYLARCLRDGVAPLASEHQGFRILEIKQRRDQRSTPKTFFQPKHAVSRNESLPTEISRGCAFNCKFCYYDKNGSALKNLDDLKEEFLRNYEMFGVTSYSFSDDCFNDNRKKVDAVCNLILQLPFRINWTSYARADLAVSAPETLDLMVASGARGLYFGFESFNTPIAKKVGKGMPAERIKEMLLRARERHKDSCLFQGSFISGLPGETPESLMATIDWLIENPVIDFISVGTLVVGRYDGRVDNITADYSDISRNPGKYGFKTVSHNPEWWEHDTMNKTTAEQMTALMLRKWVESGHDGAIGGIWAINSMYTLGFDWTEILSMARESSKREEWLPLIERRFDAYLDNYWNELKRHQTRSESKGHVRHSWQTLP